MIARSLHTIKVLTVGVRRVILQTVLSLKLPMRNVKVIVCNLSTKGICNLIWFGHVMHLVHLLSCPISDTICITLDRRHRAYIFANDMETATLLLNMSVASSKP